MENKRVHGRWLEELGANVFLGLVTTSPSSDALSDPILTQRERRLQLKFWLICPPHILFGWGTHTKKTFDIFSTTASQGCSHAFERK